MIDYGTFTVRPLSKSSRTELKDIFRVFLSATNLQLKGIRAGEHCQLKIGEDQARSVFVWPSPEKVQDSVIQTSKDLQRLCGIKLGDKVSLISTKSTVLDATSVGLSEIVEESGTELSETERNHWAWLLEYDLLKAEIISPGLILENIAAKGQKRSFEVHDVNGSCDPLVYRSQGAIGVKVGKNDGPKEHGFGDSETNLSISASGLEGLDSQILMLNRKIAKYGSNTGIFRFPRSYRPRAGGIILYGSPGTGKTLLLQRISNAGWRGVFNLGKELGGFSRTGDRVAALHKVFADAKKCQPSVITIDNLELVVGRAETTESFQLGGLGQALCEELDQLNNGFTLVVATVRSLSNIDQDLRRDSRFSVEIEIPVPNSRSRAGMLKTLSDKPVQLADSTLDIIAGRTHGYVGRDLQRLFQLAVEKAEVRTEVSMPHINGSNDSAHIPIDLQVELEDFQSALKEVRPSAIREVFVETPETKWTDIAGQEKVKKTLERALVWPIQFGEDMKRFGLQPRKGLLLFGPPGCSKTMIARAAATESGYNFLAVKGAELLKMYVGESERAVRELFRKARSVSPSIIFFDEIDAIGTGTHDNHGGSLNVLTTLLNELDGIEELRNVFVLAATNRPQIIDPALLRPGRLETKLYVGLPDLEATIRIFDQQLRLVDIEDDVSIESLAMDNLGLSGAEVVRVCQQAKENALEEQIQSKRLIKVSRDHFRHAQQEVDTVITKEMLDSYEQFNLKRS